MDKGARMPADRCQHWVDRWHTCTIEGQLRVVTGVVRCLLLGTNHYGDLFVCLSHPCVCMCVYLPAGGHEPACQCVRRAAGAFVEGRAAAPDAPVPQRINTPRLVGWSVGGCVDHA